MSVDPTSLGLAFAEFAFQNYKKIKPIFGARRADILTEVCDKYPDYCKYFIEFFSDNEVFELFKKLQKGQDFEKLLEKFQIYCDQNNIKMNTKKILEEIKQKVENFQADTNLEKIALQYLQKIPKKLDEMHEDIKIIKSKQDSSSTKTIKPITKERVSEYVNELKSKLEPVPETKFEMSFSHMREQEKPIKELPKLIKTKRKVILQGAAGGGKTMVVMDLVRKLIDEQIIPVLIELKVDPDFFTELKSISSLETEAQMDFLLKISKAGMKIEELSDEEKEKWIIVDGLNEIPSGEYQEITRQILDIVGDFSRKIGKTSVLVTDRSLPRNFISTWSVVVLEPLSENEVQKQIDEKFGKGEFEKLSKNDKSLLSVPWFLEYALNRNSPKLGSEADALQNFFKERLEFSDDDLNKLSQATFKAYQKYGVVFNLKKFEELAGKDICKKLLQNETIKKIKDDNARFEHQLLSDYLVSRYLALNEIQWTLEGFEIASLQSASFDTVVMALEQITDTEKIDKFLEAVYDWNWPAAIRCTSKATKMGAKGPSKEMEVMMLALAAQKIFDPMYRSSKNAKNLLNEIDSDIAKDLSSSKDISEVFKKVLSLTSSVGTFLQWREFFTKNRKSDIGEEDILMIKDENPLIGWTASNLLKEFKLKDQSLIQLRTIYKTLKKYDSYQNTVRWRVIHTLGSFDSKQNAELLFEALDKDPYHWTKYGAVRSLVEMASKTKDEQLCKNIIEGLKNRISDLPANVLEEIGGSANRKIVPESWKDQILPLLEECKKVRTGEEYANRWTKIIEELKEEKWKTNK